MAEVKAENTEQRNVYRSIGAHPETWRRVDEMARGHAGNISSAAMIRALANDAYAVFKAEQKAVEP